MLLSYTPFTYFHPKDAIYIPHYSHILPTILCASKVSPLFMRLTTFAFTSNSLAISSHDLYVINDLIAFTCASFNSPLDFSHLHFYYQLLPYRSSSFGGIGIFVASHSTFAAIRAI